MTVTEIAEAGRLGSEYVKLYPAMDPSFVTAVQMPRPWSRIVANGPIDLDNVDPWFEAGATGVGTMAVAPPQVVASGQHQQITTNVKAMLERITDVRARLQSERPSASRSKDQT